MELLVARSELSKKPTQIDEKKIEALMEKSNQKIFYFDRENSHKTMMDLVDVFENKGYSVYLREVKFGLDDNDYLYEVHIL
ncbi:MAG: hypothetical protein HXX81_01150 [Campylobacterales bacterium]|nr:hypothetical protein [Campylobacterales bacterium]